MSKQTIITADHLNATHLGEKIIITVTDIIMHLSNQLNDDIKATVHGDTELVIEVNGK